MINLLSGLIGLGYKQPDICTFNFLGADKSVPIAAGTLALIHTVAASGLLTAPLAGETCLQIKRRKKSRRKGEKNMKKK